MYSISCFLTCFFPFFSPPIYFLSSFPPVLFPLSSPLFFLPLPVSRLHLLSHFFPRLLTSEGAGEALPLPLLPPHDLRPSCLLPHPRHFAPPDLPRLLPAPHHRLLAAHPGHFPPPSPPSVLVPLHGLLPTSGSRPNQNEPGVDSLHTLLRAASPPVVGS